MSKTIEKKSFEISYALVRIAERAKARGGNTWVYLEDHAMRLLVFVSQGEHGEARKSLVAIEHMVHCIAEMEIITNAGAALVVREIRALDSELDSSAAQASRETTVSDSEVESLFEAHTRKEKTASAEKKGSQEPHHTLSQLLEASRLDSELVEISAKEKENEDATGVVESSEEVGKSAETGVSGEMRQSLILDYVREAEGCKLKDLQESFPKISERTLRYDLQKLVERGLIERVGTTGPSIYYQPRYEF